MGNRCSVRGNNKNIFGAKIFLDKHNLKEDVNIESCQCKGLCEIGPNIYIDEKRFGKVESKQLQEIFKEELL